MYVHHAGLIIHAWWCYITVCMLLHMHWQQWKGLSLTYLYNEQPGVALRIDSVIDNLQTCEVSPQSTLAEPHALVCSFTCLRQLGADWKQVMPSPCCTQTSQLVLDRMFTQKQTWPKFAQMCRECLLAIHICAEADIPVHTKHKSMTDLSGMR
jgi:hypothetical protein